MNYVLEMNEERAMNTGLLHFFFFLQKQETWRGLALSHAVLSLFFTFPGVKFLVCIIMYVL